MSGYLHRDPSLGNVLLAPVKNVEGFKIPEKFLKHVSSLKNREAAAEIEKQCEKLEEFVAKLGISNNYSAVITDGDLSIPWRKYWDVDRRAAKSGTPEFMSRALLRAKGNYLHSPVDDIESFFWVALWSVLFNATSGELGSDVEEPVRGYLINNDKNAAIDEFAGFGSNKRRNPATQCFQDVITDWWGKVRDLYVKWDREVMRDAPPAAGSKYYLPHFHRFALRGVLDVLEVLHQHRNGDIDRESWSK